MPTTFVKLAAAALLALVLVPLALATGPRATYLPLVTNGVPPLPVAPTAAPTATPRPSATPPPIAGVCYDEATEEINPRACEDEIIRLVNIERVAHGCPAAVRDERLMQGARNWAAEMGRTGYRHAPIGWYTLPENGAFPNDPGENITGIELPENAVAGWMGSQGHRNLILFCPRSNPNDPSYDPHEVFEIGVGFVMPGGIVLVIH